MKLKAVTTNSTGRYCLVYNFIPLGRFSSFAYNSGRPIMIWSAMKLPDELRSFAGLRICGDYNLMPRLRFFFLRSISAIS